MRNMGKVLIGLGLFLLLVGIILMLGEKIGLGKLPGDIFIKRGNTTIFFPIVSCIIVSLVLSIIANIFK